MTFSKMFNDVARQPLLERLISDLPIVMMRGIAATLLGIVTLFWPSPTLVALALIYAVYAITDGGLALVAAFSRGGREAPTWWLAAAGLLNVICGLVALSWPMTVVALAVVLGMWALLTGAVQLVGAFQLREEIEGEWLLALGGVVMMTFGVTVTAFPNVGTFALTCMIALYALAFGATWIALALRLRNIAGDA